MVEPSRARSRQALAAGVAAAIAVAAGGFVIGRGTRAEPQPVPAAPRSVPTPTPSPAPPVVGAERVLDRQALLDAVRAGADAFAAGQPAEPALAALDGRRFELVLPFGCRGPAATDAALGWSHDRHRSTLRVAVRPARFDVAAWLGDEPVGVDLIEGFWIERPWTDSDACPPSRAEAPTTPEYTVAVVQLHGTGGSRVDRRDGDAFQSVAKLAPDALPATQGLRLRLIGRVASAPAASSPVICRAFPARGQRPVCLLSVVLDEVAIADPATASTLATWEVSGGRVEAD